MNAFHFQKTDVLVTGFIIVFFFKFVSEIYFFYFIFLKLTNVFIGKNVLKTELKNLSSPVLCMYEPTLSGK